MRRWLGQQRRRWNNIGLTLIQRLLCRFLDGKEDCNLESNILNLQFDQGWPKEGGVKTTNCYPCISDLYQCSLDGENWASSPTVEHVSIKSTLCQGHQLTVEHPC